VSGIGCESGSRRLNLLPLFSSHPRELHCVGRRPRVSAVNKARKVGFIAAFLSWRVIDTSVFFTRSKLLPTLMAGMCEHEEVARFEHR